MFAVQKHTEREQKNNAGIKRNMKQFMKKLCNSDSRIRRIHQADHRE